MVDIDTVYSKSRDGPPSTTFFTELSLFLRRSPDALRLMKAEQTSVHLTGDAFCAEQVVEEPLLSQLRHGGIEDRQVERAELIWLVDGDEEILHL
jgi:hypothetical protein